MVYISFIKLLSKEDNKTSNFSYFIEGIKNINTEWMKNLKNNYRGKGFIKILPLFEFSEWDFNCYRNFFGTALYFEKLAKLILNLCHQYSFHGLVLDWGYVRVRDVIQIAKYFLQTLHINLIKYDMNLILVIPGIRRDKENLFEKKDFKELSPFVDRFSLNLYDFSSTKGPISPISYIHNSITDLITKEKDKKKILAGINFFGKQYFDINPTKTLLENDYINLLKKENVIIKWDNIIKEHIFNFKKSTVYYPTLKSISERLDLIKNLKVEGISIW
jgi:spore germination protein YaaH